MEAKSCIGKVIWSVRMDGRGIMKIRKSKGNKKVFRNSFPNRNKIIPTVTISMENLVVKCSVARFPIRKNVIPIKINPKPTQLPEGFKVKRGFRLS